MKKVLLYGACFVIAAACAGILPACDDFFERDISQRQVEAVSPADQAKLGVGTIAFRWNRLSDATGYRFTLATTPARNTLADTLIYADSLSRSFGCTFPLGAGEYEWSVSAFNGAYETATQVRSLTVAEANEEEEALPASEALPES